MKAVKARWIITAAIAATLALGVAATVYAAEPATQPGHHGAMLQRLAGTRLGHFMAQRAGRFHQLQADLALTDEQKTAFHTALQAHRSEIAAAIKPVAESKRVLRDAVLADSADEAAIRAAADKLGKSIGDAAVAMAKIKEDIKAQVKLTPAQEKTLKEFRAERDTDVDTLLGQPH